MFTFIMEDPSVNEETKKYVLKINLFDYNQKTGERKYYFLIDEIIYCMYNNKLHDLLENTMLLLHKNNENLLTKFIHCYDYPKKYISETFVGWGFILLRLTRFRLVSLSLLLRHLRKLKRI